jgi:hypothetical protein
MKRPVGISILAILAALAGVFAAVQTLQWLGLFPWLGQGPAVRTFNLWYAFCYGLLTWIYIWVFQMLWTMQEAGWLFVVFIAVWDLTLGLIHIITSNAPTPDVVTAHMFILLLILIYAMLPGTRRAFGRA